MVDTIISRNVVIIFPYEQSVFSGVITVYINLRNADNFVSPKLDLSATSGAIINGGHDIKWLNDDNDDNANNL